MSDIYAIDTPPNDGRTIDAAAPGQPPTTDLPQEALPISKLLVDQQFDALKKLWQADADHSREWRKNAEYWFAFRAGEQWTEEDRALLDSQERPHIVFNRVLTILKAVAGMEINGRHEVQFIPRGTEDTQANEVLSAGSKWMSDTCDGEDEESQAFDQCCTTGMGWTEERLSYTQDPQGLYVEEMIDCREMYWDRRAKKKNVSDAKRVSRVRRMTYGDAARLFPGKTRDQLDAVWAVESTNEYPLRSIEERRRRTSDTDLMLYDDQCEVTIVHMQWVEYETYWLIADEMEGKISELTDDQYKRLVPRMQALGMQLHAARMEREVYKQAFLGNEMLKPASPAPIKGQFSWKCITGEFDASKNTWFGLVKVMRDPQMWANKWLSQILHMLNSTAKGGIIAELDAFEDMAEAEDKYAHPDTITWATAGAVSGNKIMEKPGAGKVDAYLGLMTFAISSVKDVTGINLELLGQQDQNQPGILEAMRKQAGMTVLATLFDSLRRYRKQIGRTRLFFMQTFLSNGRFIRVAGPDSVQAIRLAKESTTGEYDVVIDNTPTSPNQKEQNWAIIQPLLAVFKEQLMANPAILGMLIEYSPLPARIVEAIKSFIKQQTEDPQARQEQQENRRLLVDSSLAKIAKDQSTAELNLAKAQTSQATAMYDIAMARNLLEDNNMAGLRAHLEAMESAAKASEAEARAHKTVADAEHTRAKAAREFSGIENDRGESRARQMESVAGAHKTSQEAEGAIVGRLIEHLSARSAAAVDESVVHRNRAGAVKDLALAHKARKDANRPRPAAS